MAWLRNKGFEILEVSTADAFKLGVNAISLGDERVLSRRRVGKLNERLRALGLEVLDPDLSMFTMGGGGAHCLAQALDRDPRAERGGGPPSTRRGSSPTCASSRSGPPTSGGAQRVCWSPTWREARALLGELLGELGLEPEVDEAGNLWARLEGDEPRRRWRSARTSTRCRTAAGSTARSG